MASKAAATSWKPQLPPAVGGRVQVPDLDPAPPERERDRAGPPEPPRCLGAPMMMVDHVYYENLTPEKVDEILDRHK